MLVLVLRDLGAAFLKTHPENLMGPPERWLPPFQGFVQAPTVVFQPTVAKKWGNSQHYVCVCGGGLFSPPETGADILPDQPS